MGSSYDDGMEGGADPCGAPGPGPAFPTGSVNDGMEGGNDPGGIAGGGGDVSPPAGSSTNAQPRPEEWIK